MWQFFVVGVFWFLVVVGLFFKKIWGLFVGLVSCFCFVLLWVGFFVCFVLFFLGRIIQN